MCPVSKSELSVQLGISRASLYYKPKRPSCDEALRQAIESVMREHPGYGQRRVASALGINRKRAKRVMSLYKLKPARRCRSPRKPEDSGRGAAEFRDITRVLSPIAPNVIWVGDFTFLFFKGQFVYLATVLDRFSAEVLGVSIMVRHTAELVVLALKEAILNAKQAPLWCHTDQGSEYNSDLYLTELAKNNIQVSMSPKASPWRNGAQESFFGRFKIEFGDPERFVNLAELIEAIHAFIAYYNQQRIHTRFKMPPAKFHADWREKQKVLIATIKNESESEQRFGLRPQRCSDSDSYCYYPALGP